MLCRLILGLGLLASAWLSEVSRAHAAPPCQFVLGFATLHTLLPDRVGDCLEDEQFSQSSGDSTQRTTGGLLVWRKLDNWTAFTDGYRTWVSGPNGLETRLNTVRFAWEANPDGLPVVSPTSATHEEAGRRQGTFRFCGADGQVAQAIAQFIGGHTFDASLVSEPGGCAALTVDVSTDAVSVDQRTSTSLTVDHLSVQIVTDKGTTDVTLGTA